MIKPDTYASLVDMLLARVPALRAAGVTSLHLPDGVALTLGDPPAPPAPARKDDEHPPAPPSSDPMSDPATYPGGRIPGFERPKRRP